MKNIVLFAIVAVFGFATCKSNNAKTNKDVATQTFVTDGKATAKQFHELVAGKSDITLLDVRTAEEYATGKIPHATNFDYQSPEFSSLIQGLDKTKPVYVYCQRGGRSADAAELMRKEGFKQVVELNGGLIAWKKEGFGLEDEKTQKEMQGISAAKYAELVASRPVVLVDFSAVWCGPCKKVTPIVRQIAAEKPDLFLLEIDVDKNAALANGMGIDAIPLLHIYKNGKLAWSHIGLVKKEEIERELR